MLTFLGKRILQLIPTLFFVSVLIFSLQQLLPGDPALMLAGEERDPAGGRADPRSSTTSTSRCRCSTGSGSGRCCAAISASRCATRCRCPSCSLQAAGDGGAGLDGACSSRSLIGIPAGVISAARKGTPLDVAANVVALSGLSAPHFWLGIMLILLFAVQLGWLPASGYVPPRRTWRQNLATTSCRPSCSAPGGRRADAPHPRRHAAGAQRRLRAHRARQGPAGALGRAQARAAQRAHPGHHPGRDRVRALLVGRGAHRADLRHPRLRQAARRRRVQPRLRGGAGRRAGLGHALRARSISLADVLYFLANPRLRG